MRVSVAVKPEVCRINTLYKIGNIGADVNCTYAEQYGIERCRGGFAARDA
jgi:hypothetical protein